MKKLIPILISIILLFLAFHKTNLVELSSALLKINYRFILLSIPFVLLSLYFRMKRWKSLLIPLKKEINNSSVFSSMIIGVMGNHILPARAGEFIGAYLLGRKKDISKISVFGTVIMERLLDIFVILLISVSVINLIGFKNHLVRKVALVGVAMLVFINVIIFLFLKNKTFFQKILMMLSPQMIRGKITQLLDSLSLGLSTIKTLKHFFIVFFWTFLFWVMVICAFLPLLYGFNYGAKLPIYTVFVLVLFITFGMAIPAAPAGIGIYEYAAYLALSTCLPLEAVNSPGNLAQIGAFSIISHLTLILPEIFLGYIYFLKEDLTWDTLINKDENITFKPPC